jgi:type VI secretion system protein ImpM
VADDASIGFFGKLPVMGDFVVRRLPMAFVAKWDDWLQEGISRSRQLLGDQWLNTYLVAPVWRFCLQPGVIDSKAWCGLMFPSVDRVGRYFPLALFAPLPADADLAALTVGQSSWFDQLETLAMQALNAGLNFEAWDSAVRDFARPRVELRGNAEDATVPISPGLPQKCLHIVIDSHLESGHILAQHTHASGPPRAWWWRVGDAKPETFEISEALPDANEFVALIDQQWTAHGWVVKTIGGGESLPGHLAE